MKDVECKENGFNMDCAVLSKKYKIAWLYGVLLGFYCLGMVVYSRYTFNLDDIWMWLNIYEGKAIFNGYNPESGRFFPLASLDLNILMYFTNNPYVYFVFNAILVGYFGVLLWRILSIITGGGVCGSVLYCCVDSYFIRDLLRLCLVSAILSVCR